MSSSGSGGSRSVAKLVLCDDHHLVLDGLRRVCERAYEVIGAAATGDELLGILRSQRVDCVLLDLGMPVRNGLELISMIRRRAPDVKILIVTAHNDRRLADASLSAGAHGFVPKVASGDELISAVSEVLAGHTYVSRWIPAVSHSSSLSAKHLALSSLTPRQHEVFLLMGEGKSCAEICGTLGLGASTLTFHKYRIMRTLGIRADADLIRYAVLIRAAIEESTPTAPEGK
jgi:DNA-binding NarL/FixJ family response regulator